MNLNAYAVQGRGGGGRVGYFQITKKFYDQVFVGKKCFPLDLFDVYFFN